MTIKELKGKTYNQVFLSTELTYLVFGGQGSVYVSKLEYCPAKKQLKLLSEHKDTFRGPVRFQDLLIYPDNTEILIEGYPGDDQEPQEWVTPNELEVNTQNIDFQHYNPEDYEDQ